MTCKLRLCAFVAAYDFGEEHYYYGSYFGTVKFSHGVLTLIYPLFPLAGNRRFRDIITECIPEYNRANSRLEKSLVVHSIVESVRGEGGRFLKESQTTGDWYGKLISLKCDLNVLINACYRRFI